MPLYWQSSSFCMVCGSYAYCPSYFKPCHEKYESPKNPAVNKQCHEPSCKTQLSLSKVIVVARLCPLPNPSRRPASFPLPSPRPRRRSPPERAPRMVTAGSSCPALFLSCRRLPRPGVARRGRARAPTGVAGCGRARATTGVVGCGQARAPPDMARRGRTQAPPPGAGGVAGCCRPPPDLVSWLGWAAVRLDLGQPPVAGT
ncbi:hypothetical protein BS78_K318700 [Paspalum vaginatum]|uniref:Uncharacterized protein n=1 Tax=Paspalum vaginatum TaxID=158149 RepID=A0A9W8CGG5_9POAL|nr:hypothetical protein BS78_K318700 [Paspalum vaginatum]